MLRAVDAVRRALRGQQVRAGVAYRRLLERLVVHRSLTGDAPVLEPARFPWTRTLEAGWPRIRAEADALLRHLDELPSLYALSPEQSVVTRDDRWRTVFLHAFGRRMHATCARCPETARLVEQVPGMRTAFFSVLAPGKRIPAHRGPWRGVLRYHLGLVVPEPSERCTIRVGTHLLNWHEGESLLFDDAVEHEVWNDTAGWRVALVLDVLRPLAPPFDRINARIVDHVGRMPIFAGLATRQECWERDVAALWDEPAAPPAPPTP